MQSFDTESDDRITPSARGQILPVCPVDALPKGSVRRFELPNGEELAIYSIDGEYYATDNACPHRGAALSEGGVVGHIVECGLHGWQFDVRSGECLTVRETIRTFEVRVIEETVCVVVGVSFA